MFDHYYVVMLFYNIYIYMLRIDDAEDIKTTFRYHINELYT